ncbi:uncharacterized protein MONBRDRAFT_18914 [Monosiga brevicollis MX1]|uniref:aspartyl aminopeptidase n=1 Tax=Monosiga brevicollis TaxID=81824 RepID=A9UYA6_MONBE|nr:uncharacterized protein MONBRDRAFT_18914 [Monosiga brevicollis MX1]EDQ89988.1 predicted protein [Monosiga brevicollis MX1]|eukprot:XP_001745410.1 hypothetical protein [Monosiga brevicollis MX1]
MAPTPAVEAAEAFLQFVDASPSPFHAVEAAKTLLSENEFEELCEGDAWNIDKGGKYYFTRNQSTLVAFTVGEQWQPGHGFSIVGAHTDSPCLRVKPNSKIAREGYLGVAVECYGGGLWHTWFDRDLGIAGRVMVGNDDGGVSQHLVRINRPILRVPNLAIHLDRDIYTNGFNPNKETHLAAVLATEAEAQLNAKKEKEDADGHHHAALVELIATECGVSPDRILDFEMCLFDTQPSAIGGLHNEFILAPRLDNLNSSFCALKALLASVAKEGSLAEDPSIRLIALFDHEEVGSDSAQGAGSALFDHTLRRLCGDGAENFARAMANSFVISADMAHAVHMNRGEKHEGLHRPKMNQGVVIKFNANQRYATNAVTASILRLLAKKAGVPLQDFVVRQDMGCGSTIGPILASGLGIRTIDVGNPQLAMHSIREMGGVKDVAYAIDLFKTFFKRFPQLDGSVHVDAWDSNP